MKRYHDDFPAAPQALVSGISAICGIPTILGARVGRDGSVFLDVYQDENFHLDLTHLLDLSEYCGVDESEVEIENGPDDTSVTVSVSTSHFDFSALFEERDQQFARDIDALVGSLVGKEDSEESVEAHASTVNRRV